MEHVFEVLKEYSKVLSSKIGVFTGVLYGSMARGDYNVWSDIDFLVISGKLPENPLKRLEFLYSLTDTPIEVKGYTRDEFLRMIEKRNPLALDALVEGKVIVDDGFWEIAKNKFEETKKKYELVKENKSWISLSMRRSFFKRSGKITFYELIAKDNLILPSPRPSHHRPLDQQMRRPVAHRYQLPRLSTPSRVHLAVISDRDHVIQYLKRVS